LGWQELEGLLFEQPDRETFPALELGYEVARNGGTCGAILNAANEAAVARFLADDLSFLDIPRVCGEVLAHHHYCPRPSLAEVHAADRWARQEVKRWKATRHPTASLR
jgi:1-deoxy-D-xylulose-5-phosphate reductoisomerase